MTPGAGSRPCSGPRAPTDGARPRTSASKRKAVAGDAAEFQKPLASRPTAEATGTPQKKGGGDRQGKGQGDPVKTFNRFGSLEDDTGMEVEAPQTSLPSF